MFNPSDLKNALVSYKNSFVSEWWSKEKYKWEAVKWFQDNWDINASDFAEMLNRSLGKTFNLLASNNNFPRRMIIHLAEAAPEDVRAMFLALFDENEEIYARMNAFKSQSSVLLKKYGEGAANHYQSENAISTYLWLRYPNKYYIYKISEVSTVASKLHANYSFRKGAYTNNIRNFLDFYDEVNSALKEDSELISLFQSQLTETCYPDPELKTLTIDVGFFISRYYSPIEDESSPADENEIDNTDFIPISEDWGPSLNEYTPGFSKEQWLTLLNNKEIIGPVWGGTLAAFYEAGGAATCKQIAQKYSIHPSAVNRYCINLSKRIHKVTQCPLYNSSYWPILFQGKYADSNTSGSFVWKLRPELYEALTEFDIMRYKWKTDKDTPSSESGTQYWWLNANPKIWSFSNLGIGESEAYTLYNQNGNKRRIFQNFLDAKAGDIIIGYESYPVKQIVALGRVLAEQDREKLLFEKTEGLISPIDYTTLKECPELAEMEYFQNPQGSLFKLSKSEFDFIMGIIREENSAMVTAPHEKYSKSDFLREVYMTEKHYESLVSVLRYKKNIILQGAPGVGKTFTAQRLAWSMMGEQDNNRIEFIQFHQSYSYEDFMMGYKPVENGFELKYGVFYRFCQKAANQPDKEFFFIIDEINRGNMSKIFGELLMLIEKDYRGTKATLAYNGLPFSVPKNLYIIGMMNTADRSLAMIDYALRRRFSFFEMEPGFDSDGFIRYQKSLNNATLNKLISRVKELNQEITLDKSLGKGFCIGHSCFCGKEVCTDEWLHSIVDNEILPTLAEYWFDDASKLQRWESILQGVFQ